MHCRKSPKRGSRCCKARGRVGTEIVPLDMFSQTLFQGVVHIQCSESVQGWTGCRIRRLSHHPKALGPSVLCKLLLWLTHSECLCRASGNLSETQSLEGHQVTRISQTQRLKKVYWKEKIVRMERILPFLSQMHQITVSVQEVTPESAPVSSLSFLSILSRK